jgi:hypothetical protein
MQTCPHIHHSSLRVAKTINEIMTSLDPEIKGRTKGIVVRMQKATPPYDWVFSVSSGKSSKTYEVLLRLDWEPDIWALSKAQIKLSCSCPYWQYQGPEYHAKEQEYLLGDTKGTATSPDVKDPEGTHLLCKHAAKVLDVLIRYARKGKRTKKVLRKF